MDEPRVLGAGDLKSGLTAAFERDGGEQDIQSFAALSGDHNPLHADPDYARSTNYGRQVAHGAFPVALASTMAGRHLPGRSVVVGSYHPRFPAPLFIPSRVRVQGEITSWMPLSNTGTLRVSVVDAERAKPLDGLSAYSLVKATLEHTVRLLAPEPARKGITMNAVLPSFMPTGMNSTATKKAVLGETARVPAGRLSTPLDVAAAVKYLLSRESSFVAGQMFPLTGGQL
jgi:acyl dehydratase